MGKYKKNGKEDKMKTILTNHNDHRYKPVHNTIYFCRLCGRAWQVVNGEFIKYSEWIKGDIFETCQECKKEKKMNKDSYENK